MAQDLYTYEDLGDARAQSRGVSAKFIKDTGLVEVIFEVRSENLPYYSLALSYDQDLDQNANDYIALGHINAGIEGYPVGFSDLVPAANYIDDVATPAAGHSVLWLTAFKDWTRYKVYWFPFTTSSSEAVGGEALEKRTVKLNIKLVDASDNVIINKDKNVDIDLSPYIVNKTARYGNQTYIEFEEPTVKKVVRARPKFYVNTEPDKSGAPLTTDYMLGSSWLIEKSIDDGSNFSAFETESNNNAWFKKGVKLKNYPASTSTNLDMTNLDNFYFEDQVFRRGTQITDEGTHYYWIDLNTKIAEETY